MNNAFSRLGMRADNIYLDSGSVSSFLRYIRYSPQALREVARITQDYFIATGKVFIRILDIGVGDGAFTIPILEYFLNEKRLDFRASCFDISEYMIQALYNRLSDNEQLRARVSCIRKDAEHGLLDTYTPNSYELVVITFVLHYITNWQRLLDDVHQCLTEGGLFVQGEIIGDLRNIDGKFDTASPPIFEEFWREYFNQRKKYAEWNPTISVSDLSLVFHYCLKELGFNVYQTKEFTWGLCITWKDLCSWIADAPVSSLGIGLDNSAREDLAAYMRRWLAQQSVDLNTSIELKWGFRITWLIK